MGENAGGESKTERGERCRGVVTTKTSNTAELCIANDLH